MNLSIQLKEKYPEIADTPIVAKFPHLWGDMDSAKHVNNLVYMKWTETSRIMLFEKLMDTSFDGKEGPILGWQDCKYIFPLTFPDVVLVTARVEEVLVDRFMVVSRIYSERHSRIVALSEQSIVPYDYVSLKKIEVPESWKGRLALLT